MSRLRYCLLLLGAAVLLSGCGSASTNPRYAFVGDSLTQLWPLPRVNLGVYGQTSERILARFPQQVPNHGYTTVFILAGTNDVLSHVDSQVTVAHLERMVQIAQSAHIEPVLAEIPPIYAAHGIYLPAVEALNQRIVQLAAADHVKIVNYYGALVGHPDFESDGVHMKHRGYLMMDIALMRTKSPF